MERRRSVEHLRLLRKHLRQRVEYDDQLPAILDAAHVQQHKSAYKRSGSTAGSFTSSIPTTISLAAPFSLPGHVHTGRNPLPGSIGFQMAAHLSDESFCTASDNEGLVVGAAYVGTESRELPFARDINYPVLTPGATTGNILSRRPNTAFGPILLLQSDQSANYHGLQVTTAMRMSHHVSFNAFYTFSKTLSSTELYNSTNQGLAQNYSILSEARVRATPTRDTSLP